jgi:large subunit ribosomal protein L13
MVVKQGQVRHDWYVVDAQGTPVGRVAARAAKILMGKNKPTYSPSLDNGDFVVVINAGKAVLTGRKEQDKMYRRHTGFPGGLRETSAADMRAKHPEKLVEEAVRGMLPKNSLGRKQFKKLKVYGGATHPHDAQRPKALKLAARA